MKFTAFFLSFLIALPTTAQPPVAVASSTAAGSNLDLEPLIITAASSKNEQAQARRLKTARASGEVAAGSGVGIMAYAVFFVGTGPIGWAAGIIFFGGLTAYLSHRRLKGEDDFSPNQTVIPNQAAHRQ